MRFGVHRAVRPGSGAILASLLLGLAGCTSSTVDAGPATSVASTGDQTTPPSTAGSTTTEPPTAATEPDGGSISTTVVLTPSSTATSAPTTAAVPLEVTEDIDRKLRLTSIISVNNDGSMVGTVLDPAATGCEGSPISYYVTIDTEGRASPVSTTDEERQYAFIGSTSPDRGQYLEVNLCEGFIGPVTLYDLDPRKGLQNPKAITTFDALSGDVHWNSDGFITMMLANEQLFWDSFGTGEEDPGTAAEDPTSGDGTVETDAGGSDEPAVRVYLVNPRTGEATQSGTADRILYDVVETADGRSIYGDSSEAGNGVVVADRDGNELERFAADRFRLSPDGATLALWDSAYSDQAEGQTQLVDLSTGVATRIGEGRSLDVVWHRDSEMVAFSSGQEAFVHRLGSDETVSVGSAEPQDCPDDDFVRWGRVPMAFSPEGDLYVGDVGCTTTETGWLTDIYRVHQIVLN